MAKQGLFLCSRLPALVDLFSDIGEQATDVLRAVEGAGPV